MGGLDVIDPRYRRLWERAVEVLGADERVASVDPSGSVGDGTADAWSDLDLTVVAAPGRFDDLLADWPTWLAEITPTVFARTPIAPFIVNAVTDEGLTLDIVISMGGTFPRPAGYTVGMIGSARFDDVTDALEYAVAEELRGLAGPFVSLVRRGEHMRYLAAVPHVLGLLTTVFLAETGAPPPGKHWNEAFTAEQRAVVAALPPVAATEEHVVAFELALAEQVVTRARPLFAERGLTWPTAFARVAADRVEDVLGLDVHPWLH